MRTSTPHRRRDARRDAQRRVALTAAAGLFFLVGGLFSSDQVRDDLARMAGRPATGTIWLEVAAGVALLIVAALMYRAIPPAPVAVSRGMKSVGAGRTRSAHGEPTGAGTLLLSEERADGRRDDH